LSFRAAAFAGVQESPLLANASTHIDRAHLIVVIVKKRPDMSTVAAIKRAKRTIGPQCNGVLMTPSEFDRADFEDGWRYELISGVLIVSPIPSLSERDPNEELGRWLRNYQEQ
jgi:hypothetical protein